MARIRNPPVGCSESERSWGGKRGTERTTVCREGFYRKVQCNVNDIDCIKSEGKGLQEKGRRETSPQMRERCKKGKKDTLMGLLELRPGGGYRGGKQKQKGLCNKRGVGASGLGADTRAWMRVTGPAKVSKRRMERGERNGGGMSKKKNVSPLGWGEEERYGSVGQKIREIEGYKKKLSRVVENKHYQGENESKG